LHSFHQFVNMRKCSVFLILFVLILTGAFGQKKNKQSSGTTPRQTVPTVTPSFLTSYPSLLWEITGNGLTRPSWLFGTMHVSDKMVFNLGDSFYLAMKNAEVVALENNPEFWQEEYTNSVFYKNGGNGRIEDRYSYRRNMPNDYLRITSFAIDSYEEAIKAALAAEPAMINGMMYRTYGSQMDDFEEDTFLDMYIFQVGKKLGKRLTGVENFSESERLVMEAYQDMMKDRNKKRVSNDFEGMSSYSRKLEEAYRRGDLDLLDSLQKLTVVSDAFQEKFLYKRNEIQANSIDTIIRKSSLFVGVGAAHLPGKRGVIEMLRAKGYRLRPVMMDARNSVEKESIDKLRATVSFKRQTSPDNFYSVSIPGDKFYRFTEWSGMDMAQFADMANGSYYVVNRIKTNQLLWGHTAETVSGKIDSLLYENVPGKILKKTAITKDGYKGFDILNRTRRGDYQRYQIFITAFEMIVFKVSGTGEYITNGDEAQQFFNSIKLREYSSPGWISYQPSTGGFTVDLPHQPSILKDRNYGTDRLEYAAMDPRTGNSFLLMKANFHNYNFIEEDSFDLNLLNESYAYSSFIDRQLSRKLGRHQGYPALDAKFKHKDGSYSTVKYIVQGANYYVLVMHHRNENADTRFLGSFRIIPFVYPESKQRKDSVMNYVVSSPVLPEETEQDIKMAGMEALMRGQLEEENEFIRSLGGRSQAKTVVVGNDTTGEKIVISYFPSNLYSWIKDSTQIWSQQHFNDFTGENGFIKRSDAEKTLPNGYRTREMSFTDTASSRMILAKLFYRNGNAFFISTLTDTISEKSRFIGQFFSSFRPADSLKDNYQFARKTEQYFKDYFSTDSLVSRRARRNLYNMKFDSVDVPVLKNAIAKLNWDIPNYLAVKAYLINQLGEMKEPSVVPFLKELYLSVKDTADLQNAILSALLSQQNSEAFKSFKELILQEPPLVDDDDNQYRNYNIRRLAIQSPGAPRRYFAGADKYYGKKWPGLYDSLSLTKIIFPDFLQLLTVDDYKDGVLDLLQIMVDSNQLRSADYESYFTKIYLDAKQLLKKQRAREEKEKMARSAKKDQNNYYSPSYDIEDEEGGSGNDELRKYAVLLMPFWEKNNGIPVFFSQLMSTTDRELLYDITLLMARNGKPVSDSLLNSFASTDDYRVRLYEDLRDANMLNRFPAQYKNQKDITKSMLKRQFGGYEKIDSVAFLTKLPVTYKNKKGFVYFYKYRRMRDDVSWSVASVGMQPENSKEIDTDNDEFVLKDNRKLETGKPEQEQLARLLKEMVYSKHSSAAEFYDARSLSIYKTYLSRMVKQGRYKD
jgi:uncharacterized protein YbaP (TraB family)